MPAIVGGPINITSAEGVVNFGDSFYVSPKTVGKTFAGSGSLNTGNFVWTNNAISATNAFDPDASDQGSLNVNS
ncbi:spore germination protein [Calidifontibacillus erzurumensis]|uniref:Spore germination protein n=1 Tax=Calidifontibacillus erzurumensis TaxID=2741433 RepID=A0A8J8GGH6_9BACI|nr:spore germination protein [Calidifontibacillus erzurumensis]NSL53054.1 spore germination protein [Calidifontibacillus erzurumensis]